MKCYCCWLWTFVLFLVNFVTGSSGDRNDFLTLMASASGDRNELIRDPSTEGLSASDVALRTFSEDVIRKNLVFHYYKNGNKTFEDKGLQANLTQTGCLPTDKFAFIIHGWGQDCGIDWIPKLTEKLTARRGGCIVCIDYGSYKKDSYLRLLRYFQPMSKVITEKLLELQSQGLNASRAYMFGFSLGGQMASTIGKQFGPKPIKQVDTCDMAGPGFDFRRAADHRGAAEQVNCWHTSRNKGTRFYACHQNVRFGNCGHSQPGENGLLSSHGLCVLYYINAFDYPFYATLQPTRCLSRNPAVFMPSNYTVGYKEDNKTSIAGEIFVPTSDRFPYNLPLEQVLQLSSLTVGNVLLEGNPTRRPYRRRFPLLARNRLRLRNRA